MLRIIQGKDADDAEDEDDDDEGNTHASQTNSPALVLIQFHSSVLSLNMAQLSLVSFGLNFGLATFSIFIAASVARPIWQVARIQEKAMQLCHLHYHGGAKPLAVLPASD